jgi:hypothetical protein
MNTALSAPRTTQSRAVRTLSVAQIFSGLGNGSTLALGSILAVDLSGSEAWAGSVNTALHWEQQLPRFRCPSWPWPEGGASP